MLFAFQGWFLVPAFCRCTGSDVLVTEHIELKLVTNEKSMAGSGISFKPCISPLTEGEYVLPESVIINETKIHIVGLNDYSFATTMICSFTSNQKLIHFGKYMFANCTKLYMVDIIKSKCSIIPEYAFWRCFNLKNILLPPIEKNFRCAFEETGIEEIYFSKKLKVLEERAFCNCLELSSVNLSRTSIQEIPEKSFFSCAQLSDIIFPNTIRIIASHAIENTKISKLQLGGQVTEIYPFACAECSSLSVVDLSCTRITRLENFVFYKCKILEEISLPDEILFIGDHSFSGCMIRNFNFSSELSYLGDFSFEKNCLVVIDLYQCTNLVCISTNSFSLCFGLEILYLPETITHIYDYCFSKTNIVEFVAPESLIYIGNGCFESCENLETLLIGSNSLNIISKNAFSKCHQLSKITFPSSVSEIGKEAFANTLVDNIEFPTNLSIIHDSAFIDSVALKTADLSKTIVKYIGAKAFFGCSSLEIIVLPDWYCEVQSAAFQNTAVINFVFPRSENCNVSVDLFKECKSLRYVDISNPNITRIKSHAFFNCTSLLSISFGPSIVEYEEKCLFGVQIKILNLSSKVKAIYERSFCGMLMEISDFSKTNFTQIPKSCFENCERLKVFMRPPKLTEILDNAFKNTAISEFRFDQNITSVKMGAFSSTHLMSVDLTNCGFIIIEAHLFSNCQQLKEVCIGQNIIRIGPNAFSDCIHLENFIFGENITDFGNEVFQNCWSLKTVNMEKIKAYISISRRCFANCFSLHSIFLNNCPIIFDEAFVNCGFKRICFNQNTLDLGSGCFMHCTELEEADLGSSHISMIRMNAFYGCIRLKKVIFSENINDIDPYAFLMCTALRQIQYFGVRCVKKTDPAIDNSNIVAEVTNKYRCENFLGLPAMKVYYDRNNFITASASSSPSASKSPTASNLYLSDSAGMGIKWFNALKPFMTYFVFIIIITFSFIVNFIYCLV